MGDGRIQPRRPRRFEEQLLQAIPQLDVDDPTASTKYSHYRTERSRERTGLSEHRTDLSEYRTDLSGDRTELSMRRTGMSISRTRMSADRTLMSIMRTSLSLIAFGFTLHEAFKKALDAGVIQSAQSPRNFGLTLIALGVLLLAGGIARHVQFALELRRRRHSMVEDAYIHGEASYPVSVTLVTAGLLLGVGLLAVASIVFDMSFLG